MAENKEITQDTEVINSRKITRNPTTEIAISNHRVETVHPKVQIDAKLDYMISQVLLEMDQTSLNI